MYDKPSMTAIVGNGNFAKAVIPERNSLTKLATSSSGMASLSLRSAPAQNTFFEHRKKHHLTDKLDETVYRNNSAHHLGNITL